MYLNFNLNLSPFGRSDEQIRHELNAEGATLMHMVRNTLDATYALILNPIISLKTYYVIHTFRMKANPPWIQFNLTLLHFQVRFNHIIGLHYT